jgi:hypothetical protein
VLEVRLDSRKARNRTHGAIKLITRAAPRVAAKIEMVTLCIDRIPASEPPNRVP